MPRAKVKSLEICLDLAASTVRGMSATFTSENLYSSVGPVDSERSASDATLLSERVLSKVPAARRRDPRAMRGAERPADVMITASSTVIVGLAVESIAGRGEAKGLELVRLCSCA